jgi:hypothetical protein
MAETKYGRYLISGLMPGEQPSMRGLDLLYLHDEAMKGSNFYTITWMQPPKPEDASPPSDSALHMPPHIHKYTELLIHLGTNPDDPFDLGAEVTVVLGKEMELHTFTRTTTVYVPANFLHGWWEVKNITRPWIFIQVNQGPMHTRIDYPLLFPKEIRDKLPPIQEQEWDEDECRSKWRDTQRVFQEKEWDDDEWRKWRYG